MLWRLLAVSILMLSLVYAGELYACDQGDDDTEEHTLMRCPKAPIPPPEPELA